MKRLTPLLVLICISAGIAIFNSCKKDPVIPTLTTAAVTNITTTSFTSGGNITADGGADVTARGLCWSTSSSPLVTDSHTTDDKGAGSFVSNVTGLTPNTLYHIRAYATNKVGTAYGADVTVTTIPIVLSTLTTTAMTAITVTTAVSGGSITSDGNGTITARGVCWGTATAPTISNSFSTDGTGTGSFASNLTGLISGTLYYVRAYATNSAGTAYGNEISFTTVLGVPTNVAATAANAQATVTFTPPVSGTAISGYTVTSTPGSLTATGTASPITVTGLTNGTAYTFTVVANNANGHSAASAASNSVIPATGPGAPTIGTATKGNAQATVTFTAPASNGGSAITGYTVTSNPGNLTATGTASPLTVTGLTNGTSYTFTVYATNAKGNSVPSAASNAVTPSTVPNAPTIGTATKGNSQATVAFTAPANNGGSTITGYTVTSSPGGFTGTGSTSPITVTGLSNGTAYTFTVIATNANGNSVASSASNSVTPSTVPGAPTIGTATRGNAQATVAFTAPANNGGSTITGYTVTSSPGSFTGTGSTSPITVTGLSNGTAYTFTVVATNANGNSSASSASNSVTPSTVPGAPTIGTATEGNAQATVTFNAPANDGGASVTSYTVTSSPGNITNSGSNSPITVSGLTNGTVYTFTVVATNINGSGSSSAASNSVRPHTPTTVYDYDGNMYNIVTINGMDWLGENLRTSHFRNGVAIPTTPSLTTDISGETTPVYQWPDHDPSLNDNSAIYGRLYTWYAATDSRGVCPTGWHLPSDAEFASLESFLGANPGGKLKEAGLTHWTTPNTGATNSTNFTMLPSGDRLGSGGSGAFVNTNEYGYLWSSTVDTFDNTLSFGRTISFNDAAFAQSGYMPIAGVSIRCVK
jgi:trimeric autotransporter adhesin